MSIRRKVSLVVTGRKRSFQRHREIISISGTTGGAARLGVIYASVATTGALNGKAYIAIDTAGTGSPITD